jgi:MATE family multidrug resistance protein
MSQVLDYQSTDPDEQKRPIVELLTLALPTIAQMASYTVMHFIDTLMLSRVGDDAAAAAGTAGLFSFTLISFGFGVLLLVNALVSQSYGKKAYHECGRFMWQGLWWGGAYALMILPLIALMPRVFGMLRHEPHLVQLESDYFKIVVAASILKLASTAVGDFMLAVNRPNTVLVAAVTGVVCNAMLAWWLMLAPGGPHLGIKGAAWAQVLGLGVELLVLIGYVSSPSIRKPYNVLDWKPRWPEMRTLLKLGTPSGLQTVTDVLAWSLFLAWVIAEFGTKAMAANNYMFRYMMVSFMPCFGLSAAVTALVGRYIGRGKPEIARQRAHLGFKVAAAYMLACGLVYFFARRPLIHVFTQEPEVASIGMTLLVFAALYQICDAMYIIYNGALRGAGDTFVPSIVTGVLVWGVMLFGGYVVAKTWPQLGVAGPWTVATLYGLILGLFMLIRFTRGRWQSVSLEQDNRSDTVSDPAGTPVPAPQA